MTDPRIEAAARGIYEYRYAKQGGDWRGVDEHARRDYWYPMAEAALAAADRAAWRPISEAPKDGKPILLRLGDIIGTGMWRMSLPGRGDTVGPWDFYFDGADLPSQATHFQPLPAPPTEETE